MMLSMCYSFRLYINLSFTFIEISVLVLMHDKEKIYNWSDIKICSRNLTIYGQCNIDINFRSTNLLSGTFKYKSVKLINSNMQITFTKHKDSQYSYRNSIWLGSYIRMTHTHTIWMLVSLFTSSGWPRIGPYLYCECSCIQHVIYTNRSLTSSQLRTACQTGTNWGSELYGAPQVTAK